MLTLVVAAGLRLWRLDVVVYEVDEAAILRLAEDLVRLGRLPLAGPVFSAGIPSAPHFIYLLTPVVAAWRDPAIVSGALALANVLGIGATIWLGWRAFGPAAAIVAGVLYAASPFAVFYARRIWQPDILPPLAALLFVVLEIGLVQRRPAWLAASVPLVALGTLVHPSFGTLAPLLVIPIGVLVRGRRWLALGIGLLLAGVLAIPTLVHEIQTRWVDVADLRYFSSLHTWVDLASVQYAVALATGFAAPVDPAVLSPERILPAWLVQAGAGLELGVLLLGLGVAVMGLVRTNRPAEGRDWRRARLAGLLLWLLLPVALVIRHSLPLQAHYFLASYPAMFLTAGLGAAWLIRRGGPWRLGCVAALVAIVAIQGTSVLGGLGYLEAQDDACYGPPLRSVQGLASEVTALAQDVGASRAAVELKTDDALPMGYLLRDQYASIDLAGTGPFGLGQAAAPGALGHLPAGAPRLLGPLQRPNAVFPDGLRLLGAAVAERLGRDQRLGLALAWQVDADASSIRPHVWHLSLLDAAGQTAFETSGVDHVPATLHGQTVVSWFSFDPSQERAAPLPSGSYQLLLRLVDAWTPATLGEPMPLGAVTIGAPIRCDL